MVDLFLQSLDPTEIHNAIQENPELQNIMNDYLQKKRRAGGSVGDKTIQTIVHVMINH